MDLVEKPAKRSTIAELEKVIADLEARRKSAMEAADTYKRAAVAAEEEVKQTRAQFDDLKRRLVDAEATNQRMRGYIARVQEDDVVREDLVAIGELGGEQQLVPKRKPTAFNEPPVCSDLERNGASGDVYAHFENRRERKPPRHWVTY